MLSAKILRITFFLLLPLSVWANQNYLSVEETLIKANKNLLASEFHMIYTAKDGKSHMVSWKRDLAELLPDEIILINKDQSRSIGIKKPQRYIGRMVGAERSLASLQIFEGYAEIMLSSKVSGNTFISKRLNSPVEYARESPYLQKHFDSHTCSPDLESLNSSSPLGLRGGDASCKKIYLSITADYDLYEKKNRNVNLVTNYISGVMNNVMMIYRLEEVQIGISEIIVHQSPDAFRHLSALDDLNIFRYIRPTYNGHIALCLSGYTDNMGFAPLGGHAFLDALCNRTFSYAYVNVDGAYKAYPDYSWDIFGITHEIGHVIGSPHTHACAWGPAGNETLDDCSAPEGPCAQGPTVREGTIMSYCHLPGGPGISFAAGFGDEPGDLIRSKIESASCLDQFIPDQLPRRIQQTITANRECNDGSYTHYFYDNNTADEDDDVLVLSIDKNDQDIGNVYDGSLKIRLCYGRNVSKNIGTRITADYVPPGSDYYVMNKFWNIDTDRSLSHNVTLKLPFRSGDFDELDSAVTQALSMSEIKTFIIQDPGTAHPDHNHRNTTLSRYTELDMNNLAGSQYWRHHYDGDMHHAEFQTTTLHEYGLGAYELQALPVELIEFKGESLSDIGNALYWTTAREVNLDRFVLERSNDGITYHEIGTVFPEGDRSRYKLIDHGRKEGAYYRLKMIDQDDSFDYSPTLFIEGTDRTMSKVRVINNPVTQGKLKMTISDRTDKENYLIEIYDGYGRLVVNSTINTSNIVDLDVSDLKTGLYYLRVRGASILHQEPLIISD
ncbi:MAG: M12 family metallo-peptidase [Saprospiraceae bacterium]|nr:M12 family metallo-peptidase [Saprospiraceae bacterium]